MLPITLLSLVVSPVFTLLYETREKEKKTDGIVASYGPVIHDEEKKIVKAIYSRYAPKILLYALYCIQYTTELVSLSVCHILYIKKKSFFTSFPPPFAKGRSNNTKKEKGHSFDEPVLYHRETFF